MRNETKATAIPASVKRIVWQRDGKQCIRCHRYAPMAWACAHVVRRSQGGMGVEENIVTLCPTCHREADEGRDAKEIQTQIQDYISRRYAGWSREAVTYRKGAAWKRSGD